MALTTAQIQNAYVAFFNRPADVAGLNYWLGYTGNTGDLLNTFAQSAEYKSLYSGMNSTQMVSAVYQNLFGRAPDISGLNYWVGQLDKGLLSIGNIADAINKGAQGTDATIITNKVAAAGAFTTALDTTAEVLAYAGVNSTGLAAVKAWLAAVTSDAATVPNTDSVNTIVTTVLNNVASNGSTVTLTTGVDKATANVFNGYLNVQTGQNNETLNSGDELTGTGTNPTLNAEVSGFAHTIAPALLKGIETVNLTVSPLAPTAISVAAGNVTLNAAGADAIKNVSVTANNLVGGAVTLTNVATKVESLALSQNANNVTLTTQAAALSGTTDSIAVSLDQVTGGILTLNTNTGTNGFETVALTSEGTTANVLARLVATAGPPHSEVIWARGQVPGHVLHPTMR